MQRHAFDLEGRTMKFAIDVIWIDAKGTIVDIKHHVTPESYPEVFTSKEPARYILEVSADYTDIRNITEGGFVNLSAVGR